MSYWDINQFLAEEQPINIRFNKDAYGLEFLDKNKSYEGGIPKDQPVQVPFWKVAILCLYASQQTTINIPNHYKGKDGFIPYLNSFKKQSASERSAHIEAADIKQKSLYFYQVATMLKPIVKQPQQFVEMQELSQIFIQRAFLIINKGLASYQSKTADKNKGRYTAYEYALFKMANKKTIEYNDWRYSKTQRKKLK